MNAPDLAAARDAELTDFANKLRDLARALDELRVVGPDGVEDSVLISEWMLAKRAVPILVGRMVGHPTIADGNIGATTEIYFFDRDLGLARSFNRWYRLGAAAAGKAGLQ